MENLVNFFINIFGGLSKELIIFIISLMPILELRGGMLAAALLKIPYIKGLVICIIGNILPIPFVLMFLEKILELFEKWKVTRRIVRWLEKKADSKREQIDKYGYLGLVLFVGIPLPGTGAWTGSLVAIMLRLNKKKTFICIIIGVLLASIIMSIVSYGILGKLI
ncbi:MAG: small multi-drug export protein [Bacilli bacterium]|nr:small multi-drug export protein [Bacilli bacterium]